MFINYFICVHLDGAMWCPSDHQMEGFPYFKRFKWSRIFFLRRFFSEIGGPYCARKSRVKGRPFLRRKRGLGEATRRFLLFLDGLFEDVKGREGVERLFGKDYLGMNCHAPKPTLGA